MARQRKLTEERRNLINRLLATCKPEDAEGVQSMPKDLLGDGLYKQPTKNSNIAYVLLMCYCFFKSSKNLFPCGF